MGGLELSSDGDLAEEPFAPDDPGQLRAQHLDGDGAVMLAVAGPIDGRHTAVTDLLLDLVPNCKRVGQPLLDRVGQVGPRAKAMKDGGTYCVLSTGAES